MRVTTHNWGRPDFIMPSFWHKPVSSEYGLGLLKLKNIGLCTSGSYYSMSSHLCRDLHQSNFDEALTRPMPCPLVTFRHSTRSKLIQALCNFGNLYAAWGDQGEDWRVPQWFRPVSKPTTAMANSHCFPTLAMAHPTSTAQHDFRHAPVLQQLQRCRAHPPAGRCV